MGTLSKRKRVHRGVRLEGSQQHPSRNTECRCRCSGPQKSSCQDWHSLQYQPRRQTASCVHTVRLPVHTPSVPPPTGGVRTCVQNVAIWAQAVPLRRACAWVPTAQCSLQQSRSKQEQATAAWLRRAAAAAGPRARAARSVWHQAGCARWACAAAKHADPAPTPAPNPPL